MMSLNKTLDTTKDKFGRRFSVLSMRGRDDEAQEAYKFKALISKNSGSY